MPSVPQLAPEIRVLPMDELMLYEGGEEDPQADANGGGEVDLDGQVDVCALEDGEEPEETIETEEATPTVKQMKIQPPSVKVENEEEPNSARYRILRKTGNETFAARTKRDAAKKNDDVVLGCESLYLTCT
jgi:hypothetical protein